MDISKLNKTIEKYQHECDAIAEKLEVARQALIDDPTDESRLKAIRNLESQLTDWKSLLQASETALIKQQSIEAEAKEKAIVDECKRLKAESDKAYDKAMALLVETIKAMEKVKDLVIEGENVASHRRELNFGARDQKYPDVFYIYRLVSDWYQEVIVARPALAKMVAEANKR